ncbi:MAG: DNA repair protein RadC [Proteiniphilum sp.]|jgi:DNA repair protein RadC|nr:DNA repair protein RadC [Proteiniphilum sp.]
MERLSIKQWAEEDRPREKLLLKGVAALSDSELLAILIGSGNDRQSAVELARHILSKADNDLNRLARMNVGDLTNNFRGIGQAKAVTLIAALELGRRKRAVETSQRKKITSSSVACEHFFPLLSDLNHEEMWALLTDRSNRVLSAIQVSRGGLSGTVVDIRLILREALGRYASGVILGHNHPSGQCDPSSQDRQITRQLKEAAQLMDISLLDHIIVGGENFFSFADRGLL